MTLVTPEPYDPDEYRMSLGDHLEELRVRLIKALIGFFIAFGLCLIFSREYIFAIVCKPLLDTLFKYEINPQMYYTGVGDPFVVYIKVSIICAIVIAGPWIIYQLWAFVAAGLYPKERKLATRYIPLSIVLLLSSVLLVYLFVLPWTLEFFVYFSGTIKLPERYTPSEFVQPDVSTLTRVQILPGDPKSPVEGQTWFDRHDNRLKMFINQHVKVVQFAPENMVAPIITLPDYIDLVLMMILTFAVSFQLPIGIMAIARLGLVDVQTLRDKRKLVYFIIVIVAAVITPGDVITATIALMVPLIGLYELGIFLARPPRAETLDADVV